MIKSWFDKVVVVSSFLVANIRKVLGGTIEGSRSSHVVPDVLNTSLFGAKLMSIHNIVRDKSRY